MWKKYKYWIIGAIVLVVGFLLVRAYRKGKFSKQTTTTATNGSNPASVTNDAKTTSQAFAVNKALSFMN